MDFHEILGKYTLLLDTKNILDFGSFSRTRASYLRVIDGALVDGEGYFQF